MKISFVTARPATSGTAVIPVFDGDKKYGSAKDYYSASKGAIAKAAKAAKFSGKAGQRFDVYAPAGSKASRLHIVGLGKKDKFNPEMLAANVVKGLLFSGDTTLTFHLDGLGLTPDQAARAAVGARLAAYQFNRHKTKLPKNKKPTIASVKIAYDSSSKGKKAYDNFHGPVCDGIIYARDLVNEPPNVIYPKAYAARVKKLADLGLKIEVLGEKRMATLGMHALLGVGLGSERESQLVVMRWDGGKKGAKPAALIGKGVTFDTGGISLKPGAGMWDMKGDMGGSAAVVGAMIGIAGRKAKANVIGIIGLVENMPDGRAQNPGDIVKSMSGQTIEVLNTDAEGRLVLADALHYARTKYKPAAMIDLATLTGAIIVSLGHEHAGVFSNDDGLAEQISAASESSGERSWRLPLLPEYDKLMDTPNADMKNLGGKAAGSITAAQFLQRFVGDTSWAHIDVAGTAMKNERHDPRETTFGTGYGVRLLNHWIAENFEG
ncbi:MAG: leucyl aminopeptidase [Hellea sp.]|nr:leucyl aminopeptidase [Hellea sp.]